jgi:hypothetical protein
MVMLKMAASSEERNKQYCVGSKWWQITPAAEVTLLSMTNPTDLCRQVLPRLSSYKFVNSYMVVFNPPLFMMSQYFDGKFRSCFFSKQYMIHKGQGLLI